MLPRWVLPLKSGDHKRGEHADALNPVKASGSRGVIQFEALLCVKKNLIWPLVQKQAGRFLRPASSKIIFFKPMDPATSWVINATD